MAITFTNHYHQGDQIMIDYRLPRIWLAMIAASALLCSGTAGAQSAVPESQLETFLGLSQGDLSSLNNGPVMNGSAIMQTITVGAGGGTLAFDYDFLTNAPSPASNPLAALNPFAFTTQSSLTDFADNFSTLTAAPSQTGFLFQTGYQPFSVNLAPGTYSWGIGVVDVTTDQFSSGLLLSDISLTSGTIVNGSFGTGDFTGWSTIGNTSVVTSSFGISPTDGPFQAFISTASVPEPSSMVLLVLGGLGVTVACRYRKQRGC
jgi:PEP-CTERM motif